MRVGLVCPYSLTVPGGVQGQVLGLTKALHRQGIPARVLAPCDGPPPDPAVTPLGNSIPTASNGSLAAIAPDPAALLRTIRALRDEAFDVVNIHEPIAPGPGLTSLVNVNCASVATFHRSGPSTWMTVTRPLIRWGANNLTLRVAVSEEAKATAYEALGGEYEVVWNGIDTPAFAGAEPWPKRGPTVLFVGRHEPRKGLGVLLDAAAKLGPDVRIWVAGRGPETDRLQKAAAGDDRIEWLGMISDEEKRRRLRAADVLAVPSLHGESFGVVLLEGMAAGTPVVASDISGYRNVARSGEEAILVPPGDAAALGGAINDVLERRLDLTELIERGYGRAEEFSMDNLARHYVRLFEKAMTLHAAAPPMPPRFSRLRLAFRR